MAKPSSPIWTPGAIGTEGCLGYWLLHEGSGSTVADISPNGNHGSIAGPHAWGSGPHGPGLAFSGLTPAGVTVPLSSPLLTPESGWWVALLAGEVPSQAYTQYLWSTDRSDAATPNVYCLLGADIGRLRIVATNAAGSARVLSGGDGVAVAGSGLRVLMWVEAPSGGVTQYLDGSPVVGPQSSPVAGDYTCDLLTLFSRRPAGVLHYPTAGHLYAAAIGQVSVPDPALLAADWLSGTFAAAGGGAAPELVLPGPLILDGPLGAGEHVWSW